MKRALLLFVMAATLPGCGGDARDKPRGAGPGQAGAPDVDHSRPRAVFRHAISEYPSWMVFKVAHNLGLIHKEKGKYGKLEEKYNVDVVLQTADYTETINMYGSGAADSVCITNLDVLNPSLTRESVAIAPTSTSAGADALIVVGADRIEDLKGKVVRGAEKSVSEYVFYRVIEKRGLNPKDYKFANMDPAAASQAMVQGQPGFDAIMVWEPFVEEVPRQRPKGKGEAKVLFDSSEIPMEVVDMVVVSRQSLESPGGRDYACCLLEAFYKTCAVIASDPKALEELSEEFSHLKADDMRVVMTKCKFFTSAGQGAAVFEDAAFPKTMKTVMGFCLDHQITSKPANIVYDNRPARERDDTRAAAHEPPNLTFETSFMRRFIP